MYPEKNLSKQGREQTTKFAVRESNPGHIGGRRVLSPLRHPCSPQRNALPVHNSSLKGMLMSLRMLCEESFVVLTSTNEALI